MNVGDASGALSARSVSSARIPLLFCRVYVLATVAALEKNEVIVSATLRIPNVPLRNVWIADQLFAVERVVARVV